MANRAFSLANKYNEAIGSLGEAKRISGIRDKCDEGTMDKIREQIEDFRKAKFASVFLVSLDDEDGVESDDTNPAEGSADVESLSFDEYRFKEMLIKHCGKIYWDFLESGHPLARFWVQLKNGIEVIPRSEYVYYIQSLLDKKIEGTETIGCNKIKQDFMKKYGFESDEEVEEYLVTILRESDVENVIGVE